MTAKIIDGKAIAERIRAEVKEAVAKRTAEGKTIPGLATVLVGENPAFKSICSLKAEGLCRSGHQFLRA